MRESTGFVVPSFDEINDVFESLWKGGTRYRSEKLAVVGTYGVIAAVTVFWVVTGIEIAGELEGRMTTEGAGEIGGKTFVVENTGGTAWHDVRIVINDRYLAVQEEIPPRNEARIEASEFRYYYHVPRPWGHRVWERAADRPKPGQKIPSDADVEKVRAKSREGVVRLELEEGI